MPGPIIEPPRAGAERRRTTMSGMQHTFSGNPLDRGDAQRRDEDWLRDAERADDARYLPLWQLNVLVESRETGERLAWLTPRDIERLGVNLPPVFLGLDRGAPRFAIDISQIADPSHELDLGEHLRFEESRAAAMHLPTPDTGILAQSRAQIDWHRRHRFCGACGHPTRQARGGHVRECEACNAQHFPRTDPVAIMLITDGERCLLGQSHGPLARTGMYSALAGFIDQGESIEEAVRREVREEAGIDVGEVRYHSSQPWPFPSSLMIGCHGRALSTDIAIDHEEMADVRWFERQGILATLAGSEGAPRRLPGPIAIAHHLIRSWASGETEFD